MKKSFRASVFLVLFFWFPFQNLQAGGSNETEEEKKSGPQDFAGNLELTGDPGALLRFELPDAVYRGLERPDRGDIRVFDTGGIPVPFTLRPPPETLTEPEDEEIPFFAWNQGTEKLLPGTTDIEIDTAGAVVRIKNREGGDSGEERLYLLDLSALPYPPSSLVVELDHRGAPFNTAVTIHAGEDLSRWRLYENKQILARFGGAASQGRINRNALELPAFSIPPRYLLLGFERGAPALLEISARFTVRPVPGGLREGLLRGEMGAGGKTVRYDTGGFFPLVSLDFILPGPDSVPALLKNRFGPGDPWIVRERGTVYRLDGGSSTGGGRNRPFELVSSAPHWELEAAGEVPFAAAPDCLIRWTAWELIFLSRGTSPWVLAYGNKDFGPLPPAFEPGQIPAGGDFRPALPTGKESYRERPLSTPPREWGPWLLWTILGVAVLALFTLAFFTVRAMRSGP